jgi:hypothetical protein
MMERAIVEYMVNAVWQFPLLAAGAWLLLRAAKPGSQVQHDVWLAVWDWACCCLPMEWRSGSHTHNHQ